METTDLHVHVFPYDYYSDKEIDTVGLSRTATLIETARAEAVNSLLLDNGDFLQGNPLGDYIAFERGMKEGDLHPIIAAMNALKFDASTLGNHEFNYGLDFLIKSLARADFPFVCANIAKRLGADPSHDQLLQPPYTILDRQVTDGNGTAHTLRIGIIGFVPPQVINWDRQHLHGKVWARDILQTAQAFVPRMKEEGCDLIIALSHSGIGEAEAFEGMENAAIPLAAMEGIDAILTGHSHLVFPSQSFANLPGVDVESGTLVGTPAVMAGLWGSHLGVIDLLIEYEGGGWRILTHNSEARPIYARDPSQETTALVRDAPAALMPVQSDHDATLRYIRRPVGHSDTPLQSYFALVTDDPSVQIVANAQRWFIATQLEGTSHAGLPILSAVAPFKAGGRSGPGYYTDIPAGDLAIKNVADLYLYPNRVCAMKVTGAGVKEWLERAAGLFFQIQPSAIDAPLLNPDFATYNFDVLDGVTYQIDLSQPSKFETNGTLINPEANRIINLCYKGAPIDPAQEFVVATNSFRANGGGNFAGAAGAQIILSTPDTNRDAVMRYIIEKQQISPRADGNWSFAPVSSATALFDTGPRATEFAKDAPNIRLEELGLTEEGFARFRIFL